MKVYKLPCYGIVIHVNPSTGCGVIVVSELGAALTGARGSAALEGVERLILAHACAGVEITAPAYVKGIETVVESIINRYGD